MATCNPCTTPADMSMKLTLPRVHDENTNEDIPYHEAVGSLMYLMLRTRPDITSSVIKASQFCTSFDQTHWKAVKHIF